MSADLSIEMLGKKRGRPAGLKNKAPASGFPPFSIRMPPELVARLNAAATANGRSTGREAVRRLEASFENESIDEHGVIVVHSPTPLK